MHGTMNVKEYDITEARIVIRSPLHIPLHLNLPNFLHSVPDWVFKIAR
jgi:hypothetical protein